ncbi:S66 peptidase family protein [Bdellovibrio svalbardensis]|uniref:LD-carboxypeptidase n=1 Tax=Bdellovibrio svalbardensis TaxID=2972972 RepID=A0ABT6DK16_9BACT|nr:S66 peptidase family protein [Bdellovibrio svalbardensis]MDG0817197.1 LD-carboxypeptidase [Bdellovibrio svalbardensis]
MFQQVIKPRALKIGDTIGIFTPSSPAYQWNEGLFLNGLETLKRLGFKVKLGNLTARRGHQGYRSGTPKDRADEFMSLIRDPEVNALMSTIGGMNSSSLIPFLDFDLIRKERKLICGFSDVTSLHVSILKFAGLRTLYGPSVMCWFGDWPNGVEESSAWFLDAAVNHKSGVRSVDAPSRWSNHKRRWDNDEWKTLPRAWQKNDGWRVLTPGSVEAPILALNLNTLMSSAGTSFWPDFSRKVLLLEDMEAPLSRTERSLQQLKLIGVFDQISGLVIGKPEVYNQEGAPFNYEDLFQEIIGPRRYPIIYNFDCSHTVPMISVPQLSPIRLVAEKDHSVTFQFLDGSIE